jgi:hypothetical protein
MGDLSEIKLLSNLPVTHHPIRDSKLPNWVEDKLIGMVSTLERNRGEQSRRVVLLLSFLITHLILQNIPLEN